MIVGGEWLARWELAIGMMGSAIAVIEGGECPPLRELTRIGELRGIPMMIWYGRVSHALG
jgi:hypothetical protein